MNRYWTRILLGALLVFGAGMVGLTVVRKGSAEVRSLLSTAASRLPLRFANVGFRLNGRRLGDVIGLDIIRNSRTETGRITGHVQLSDPEAIAELSDCTLTLEDVRRLNERTTFSCARAADLSSGELVEVGEIQFEPGSLSRPLYLPQSVVADWRRSEIQRLDASMARDGRGECGPRAASMCWTNRAARKAAPLTCGPTPRAPSSRCATGRTVRSWTSRRRKADCT